MLRWTNLDSKAALVKSETEVLLYTDAGIMHSVYHDCGYPALYKADIQLLLGTMFLFSLEVFQIKFRYKLV